MSAYIKNYHIYPMAKYPTLLLIDDDEDDRDIFAIALKTAEPDAKLITSANGPDALEKLAEGAQPDFIFIDLNMPYMQGGKCLEEIKKIDRLKDIPAIIYTTSSSKQDAEDTLKAGASYFLVKPTSLSALSDILSDIMTGKAIEYFIEVTA
ncbi:response regulator [Flavobacterium akiainvivens]|nr:response regulator [Flavobacterium akiainvivens]SFQ75139.1 Response regulator receiver domain-containing protein [Flavobacterium akiainvivens]